MTNDTPEPTSTTVALQWEAARDEVHALSLYPPDWDGEGADRVPFALVRATLRWFDRLEASGGPVPSVVHPTAGGTPVVEWYSADASSYVAYVRKPDRADMVYQLPGEEPVHVVVSLAATTPTPTPDAASLHGHGVDANPGPESIPERDFDDRNSESDSPYSQAA